MTRRVGNQVTKRDTLLLTDEDVFTSASVISNLYRIQTDNLHGPTRGLERHLAEWLQIIQPYCFNTHVR
jgi:hypothetical protein